MREPLLQAFVGARQFSRLWLLFALWAVVLPDQLLSGGLILQDRG